MRDMKRVWVVGCVCCGVMLGEVQQQQQVMMGDEGAYIDGAGSVIESKSFESKDVGEREMAPEACVRKDSR